MTSKDGREPLLAVAAAARALNAHVEAMQGMCSRYLEPAPYVAMNGMMAAAKGDQVMRDKLFISDMIWMLDGPEQREAQDALRAAMADPETGEVFEKREPVTATEGGG